jgi:subtilisin family serine protease
MRGSLSIVALNPGGTEDTMKKNQVFNLLVIVLFMAAFIPARQVALAQTHAGDELAPDAQFVPGELLVSFTKGSSPAVYSQRANGMAMTMGGKVARQYGNTALLSFTPNASVTGLLKRIYSSFPDVVVQPNYIYRLPERESQLMGSDSNAGSSGLSTAELRSLRTVIKIAGSPAFPNEVDTAWGWQQVGGEIIWSQALSTANVCLIDTGVDTAHPEFAGLTLAGYDYVNGDTIPNDDNGHGTHLAGIIMAKANNGAGTAIGIANTKLIPVKAANAQGWGTSYNIAAALTFCAAQATVKVINLSLVSSNPDPLVYTALSNAIVTKGKLVVVAAGNDSESYVQSAGNWMPASFPGGWAIPNVFKDGVYHADPTGTTNLISVGLISVAAGRDPSLQTWVDADGDRSIGLDTELYANCATEFTNYGNWVTLVAPGGNIYSTTPKSYPFYMNYQYGVPANYGVMSGTSQAAAFVSGAASRVWGIYPTMSNAKVKIQLHNGGAALTLVTDRGNSHTIDENIGFSKDNDSDYTVPYGTPFNPDDEAQSPIYVMAPFCWPVTEASAPFHAPQFNNAVLQDMSGARYLNVASAMNRVAFWVTALDGSSGMPLAGATVQTLVGTTKYTAIVPAGLTRNQPDVALINVPLKTTTNLDGSISPADTNFSLQISKTGYTTGFQTFNAIDVDPSLAGTFISDAYSRVSLLPSTIIQAVVDWNAPDDFDYGDPDAVFPDLKAVLFLPDLVDTTVNPKIGAIVGPPDMPADLSATSGKYRGAGTMTDPIKICGTTTCTFSPYALFQHDGGMDQGLGPDLDTNGNHLRLFSATEEGISIGSSGTAPTPIYLKPKYAGTYTLFVTANDPSFLVSDSEISPIVRVWAKGNLISTIKLSDATIGCDGANPWWKVVNLSASAPVKVNTCDLGAYPFFPYAP